MVLSPSFCAAPTVSSWLASSTRITSSTNPGGISATVCATVFSALYAGITTSNFFP